MALYGISGFGDEEFAESEYTNPCALVATIPAPEAVFQASVGVGASLIATIPAPVAVFEVTRTMGASLVGTIPAPVAVFEARALRVWTQMEDDPMRQVQRGTQSLIVEVEIRDTAGNPKTGLAFGAVTAKYVREGQAGAATAVVLSAGVAGAWSSGGWVELDPAGTPGLYQFGVPNAALVTGAGVVRFRFTAAGCFARTEAIQLVAYNPMDPVRAGLTALPSASAGAEGGLPLLDVDLEVAASLADPVTLTAAYDLAKTAATQASVDAVAAQVVIVDEVVDAIRATDVVGLGAAIDAVGAAVAAVAALVGGLNNPSAAAVVAALMDEVIDTVTTFREHCQLVLGRARGDVEGLGVDPLVETYYHDDGVTPLMVHSTAADGLSRTVAIP